MAYPLRFNLKPKNGAPVLNMKQIVINSKGQPLRLMGGGWDGVAVIPLSSADYELHVRTEMGGEYKQVGW